MEEHGVTIENHFIWRVNDISKKNISYTSRQPRPLKWYLQLDFCKNVNDNKSCSHNMYQIIVHTDFKLVRNRMNSGGKGGKLYTNSQLCNLNYITPKSILSNDVPIFFLPKTGINQKT